MKFFIEQKKEKFFYEAAAFDLYSPSSLSKKK